MKAIYYGEDCYDVTFEGDEYGMLGELFEKALEWSKLNDTTEDYSRVVDFTHRYLSLFER